MSGRTVRAVVTGCAVALLVHGLAVSAILMVFDRLPAEIVTHWGAGGPTLSPKADAFRFLFFSVGITVLLAVVFTLVFRRLHEGPRLTASLIAGVGSLVPLAAASSTVTQVGDTTPRTDPGWWIALGLVGALAVGAVTSLAVPKSPPRPVAIYQPSVDRSAPRTWTTRLDLGGAWLLVLALPVVVVATMLIVDPQAWPIAVTVGAVMGLGMLGGCLWRVLADRAGVSATSLFGWPRLSWRLDEIESADVVTDVSPMQLGGYGVRVTPDGLRFAFRRGAGVRLLLSDGTTVIFTTDDAASAARTINALVSDERRSPHPVGR